MSNDSFEDVAAKAVEGLRQQVEQLEKELERDEERISQWEDSGKTAIALLSRFKMHLGTEEEHRNLDRCIEELKSLHPEWDDSIHVTKPQE